MPLRRRGQHLRDYGRGPGALDCSAIVPPGQRRRQWQCNLGCVNVPRYKAFLHRPQLRRLQGSCDDVSLGALLCVVLRLDVSSQLFQGFPWCLALLLWSPDLSLSVSFLCPFVSPVCLAGPATILPECACTLAGGTVLVCSCRSLFPFLEVVPPDNDGDSDGVFLGCHRSVSAPARCPPARRTVPVFALVFWGLRTVGLAFSRGGGVPPVPVSGASCCRCAPEFDAAVLSSPLPRRVFAFVFRKACALS